MNLSSEKKNKETTTQKLMYVVDSVEVRLVLMSSSWVGGMVFVTFSWNCKVHFFLATHLSLCIAASSICVYGPVNFCSFFTFIVVCVVSRRTRR